MTLSPSPLLSNIIVDPLKDNLAGMFSIKRIIVGASFGLVTIGFFANLFAGKVVDSNYIWLLGSLILGGLGITAYSDVKGKAPEKIPG